MQKNKYENGNNKVILLKAINNLHQ